jgi:transcription antitermination factor NusG
MSNSWCILRTAANKTLALATSLEKAGYEVWTPIESKTVRVPRANIKRKVTRPLLPTYVFARQPHMMDLISLANDCTTKHEPFRVFRMHNRLPLIDDASLSALRLAERKSKPAERALAVGETVKLVEGGFAGLSGVVQSARGKFAMVQIDGFKMPLKIASWHLLRPDLQEQPDRRIGVVA